MGIFVYNGTTGFVMDSKAIEKYTSAITLSDMEIFVFPELMYSLVLANIMSPIIWKWRDADCFKKLEGKSSYKKLMRLKQFIMDEYEFNLDLETWGLTSKAREVSRFEGVLPADQISQSNALFGYQGDKYYFDVDIRKHFGLDKYESDVIPYWKTETVEAMDAFALKEGYEVGAGECVSLSALYAAAAFVVCQIPLEDIYMVLTPLHSQNFLDLNGGVLTNNRRLVTKTMWFNGTAISNKAQRALRNERVTIVSHCSGYTHCLHEDATIERRAYGHFVRRIGEFLSEELTLATFANFLRSHNRYQKYFQVCRDCRGQAKFLKAEVLFHYEHGSNYRVADATFEKLLGEVSAEDFVSYPLAERVRCDQLEEFIEREKPDLQKVGDREKMREFFETVLDDAGELVEELADFLHVEAKLPCDGKNYIKSERIEIGTEDSRETIIDYLQSIRNENVTVDLAFYAYRDMDSCDWEPFVKAAVERNPVSIEMTEKMSVGEVYEWLGTIRGESIYEGKRLASPDEVVNYGSGDGLEKAFVLANVMRNRKPEQEIEITVDGSEVVIDGDGQYRFESGKGLNKKIRIGVGS